MALYGSGIEYGSGVVYGEALYFIDPNSGPITGGTPVIISGNAPFLDTSCDDAFNGATIDLAKWTVTVVGASSSATESSGKLHFTVGPVAGNSVQLQSIKTYLDMDIEVDFSIVTPIEAVPPTDDVELATLRIYIDASNYFQVSRKSGPTFGDRYEAKVVVSGVAIESASRPTEDLSGSLRLIRFGGVTYMYAGTTEVLRRSGFPTTAAPAQIRSDSLSTPYAMQIDFDNYVTHPMVIFGTEPMLDSMAIASNRISGTTPPGVAVGIVDVALATCAGPLPIFVGGFTYTDLTQFVILADTSLNQTTNLFVSSDPVLRNLRDGRPGFGR